MVLFLTILAAVATAIYAVKVGFYETWALFFNVIVSVYLAIFLYPSIEAKIITSPTSFGAAMTIAVSAIAIFGILHGITYVFVISRFKIDTPKLIDTIAASVIGFITGWLALNFLIMVIYISPVGIKLLEVKDEIKTLDHSSIGCVSSYCKTFGLFASRDKTVQTIVEPLLSYKNPKKRKKRSSGQLEESAEPTVEPEASQPEPATTEPEISLPNNPPEPDIDVF